jgi:hypothetical protein
MGLFLFPLAGFSAMHKLHKCPDKQRYINESDKFSTKPLSKWLAYILSMVNTWCQSYFGPSYSTSGVNKMWITKSFHEKLEYFKWVFRSNISTKDSHYHDQNEQDIHMF